MSSMSVFGVRRLADPHLPRHRDREVELDPVHQARRFVRVGQHRGPEVARQPAQLRLGELHVLHPGLRGARADEEVGLVEPQIPAQLGLSRVPASCTLPDAAVWS